jgi:hypothetical protein
MTHLQNLCTQAFLIKSKWRGRNDVVTTIFILFKFAASHFPCQSPTKGATFPKADQVLRRLEIWGKIHQYLFFPS